MLLKHNVHNPKRPGLKWSKNLDVETFYLLFLLLSFKNVSDLFAITEIMMLFYDLRCEYFALSRELINSNRRFWKRGYYTKIKIQATDLLNQKII